MGEKVWPLRPRAVISRGNLSRHASRPVVLVRVVGPSVDGHTHPRPQAGLRVAAGIRAHLLVLLLRWFFLAGLSRSDANGLCVFNEDV